MVRTTLVNMPCAYEESAVSDGCIVTGGRMKKEVTEMLMTMILPVFLLIALVACLPIWPHSKKWGFYPISGVSLFILLILFLLLTGRL